MAVELRVLGTLEVVGDDGEVALPGRMHRRLLAALVLADGRSCTTDGLLDALWGASPPASARKLLHLYVSQLRKVLPGTAIVTVTSGYALDPGVSIDAARFERLAREAVRELDGGNPALAASLADRALALWRGAAYANVVFDDFARAESERLEELRLATVEDRVEAELRAGRHELLLPDVLALAGEHPLRERLQGQAMLALYRCGRQADALERYAETRRHLQEELGLEPGPELRRLQGSILRQEPQLEQVAGAVEAAALLPEPATPLVGRARELEQLQRMLEQREVRLLVLTGAGGSGKTRLALAAADAAAHRFANGVAFVELAPLRDPGLVPSAIARALEVSETPDEPLLESLGAALAPRELLLVVDNAEHVREAAPLLSQLLARAPRLVVLVTSRTVLHVSGEHVFPVQPLDEDAAVELFERRARSLQADFRLTARNAAAVRQICEQVDRLPLAVELAAARVRTLQPDAILDRLSRRLSILTGGPRDLPARQQTLSATLDWSYELLSERERTFLSRLSVFPSGATLEAVSVICLDGDEDGALELVDVLHDASLLTVHEAERSMRYRLLETVRQYAAERLGELDDRVTEGRHAAWYLALAESAEPELTGERQAEWFATFDAEHDNFRAALASYEAAGDWEPALRLAVALSRFWYVRGHLVEARRRLEGVLVETRDQPPLLRRRALTAAAAIALLQGEYPAATTLSEDALDAARQTGEPRLVANALSNLGAIVLAADDRKRAADVLQEAVAIAREVGDTRILALAVNNLGDLALTTGDYARARPLFEESHALLTTRGDTSNIARSHFNRGAAALMLGEDETAEAEFLDGLGLARQTGDLEDVAWCLEGLAAVAARRRDGERAATLIGVAGALLTRMGADFKPFERQLHEATATQAKALLGEPGHRAALERGANLTLDDALELALAVDTRRS